MASSFFRRALAAPPASITRLATVSISSRYASTSSLYGISALSNRHETQHLHKLSRLPLMEHSPTLKLIHTSEVAPGASSASFSNSIKGKPQKQTYDSRKEKNQGADALNRTNPKPAQESDKTWEEETLLAGRAVMMNYRKMIKDLNNQLKSQKETSAELRQTIKEHEARITEQAELEYDQGAPLREAIWTAKGILSMTFTLAAIIFGAYLNDLYVTRRAEQKEVLEELDSMSEKLKVEGKEAAQKVKSTVDQIIDEIMDKNMGDDDFRRQLDAMRSSPRLEASSWSSLLWKKE